MASLSPTPATFLTPNRSAALIAGGSGLVASLIVLGLVGNIVVAAGFLASALVIAGALIAYRLLYPAAVGAEAEVDWSIAHAIAEASDEALAVTDRAGRLVCANGPYQAMFDGYPTPPNLPVGEDGVAALAGAGRAAWRDGTATIDRLVARAHRLEGTCTGEHGIGQGKAKYLATEAGPALTVMRQVKAALDPD
ncbi:MAG: hypothetical protein K2P79_14090, partial [Sphingomonas sp.]|nr:hypothetical protein [Sphingomonas sp.]